jgi:hypothetical protein
MIIIFFYKKNILLQLTHGAKKQKYMSKQTLCFITEGCKIWISTIELGVSWLHVRIDSTPKYYHYTPYK